MSIDEQRNLHRTHEDIKYENLIRLICVDSYVSAKDFLNRKSELDRVWTREMNDILHNDSQPLLKIQKTPTHKQVMGEAEVIFNWMMSKVEKHK